jgi:RNA polymerase sigma-70 factor (sigma-E family)
MAADNAAYRDYVVAQLERLRRTAFLLCGDWYTADDLVSTTLIKLLRHWSRVSRMDNVDGYVRRILVRAWLDERRHRWRRERSTADVPDVPAPNAIPSIPDQLAVRSLLDSLPPRCRAVLVLRYFCDMSVDDTAEVLRCSTGTVKSQTARGLEILRVRMAELTVSKENLLWT